MMRPTRDPTRRQDAGYTGRAHGRRKDAPSFGGWGESDGCKQGRRSVGSTISARWMVRTSLHAAWHTFFFFFFFSGWDPFGQSEGRRGGRARDGRRGRSGRRPPTGRDGPSGPRVGPGSPILGPFACRTRRGLGSRTGSTHSISMPFPSLAGGWCGSPRVLYVNRIPSVAPRRTNRPSTSHASLRIVGTSCACHGRVSEPRKK
mmetsp:Transcript_5995/g.37180  ORF Transcript_5995/g.37180 Transcript_5995/m.37180 type:complete len:203 (+) Transcript_5995:896-1504(+)